MAVGFPVRTPGAPYGSGVPNMRPSSPVWQWGSQYKAQEPRMAVRLSV